MAGEEDNKRGEYVLSEKIVTDESEKTHGYDLDEKHGDEYQESVLSNAKDRKNDHEHQFNDYLVDHEDLDMAIINEVTVTEDDVNMRVLTFRAMFVAILLAALSSSVQQLMLFKPVGAGLSDTFLLILGYVICTLWARYLPKGGWLNPGPFTIKEHTCIYIVVASANVSAYGTYILTAQELFYTDSPSVAGGIFLLFATQIVGYGIAGQLRPYLVYPANMTWPLSLPVVSLLKTFNTDAAEAKWRTRFFFIIFGGIFIYEFLPQYMFPLLGGVSIVCIAKNDSVWVQRLFGGINPNEGLGILQFTFDWSQMSNMAPLVIPLWIQLNVFAGVLLLWILIPLTYYYDVWDARSLPFISSKLFKIENGTYIPYPQTTVLNPDNSLNKTLFAEVGNPNYSTSNALLYVYMNMAITASMTHVALFHGKEIWSGFRHLKRKISTGDIDIHMKLMQAYPEVPSWWYYLVFVIGIGLNIGVGYANHSQLPWWGFILAIATSSILSLPLNMITAMTGYGFGLNVFTEMICGFVLPGYPIANMYFKTIGYNTMHQAGLMARDLKISHYIKVPPKMTFLHQMVGTIVGCVFNYIVNASVVKNEREILLSATGNQFWNGNSFQTINAAAITWGAIGPMAMFGPGTKYYLFLWAFIIGFFLPIPGWYLHKKFPNVGFQYFSVPMFITGMTITPGSSTSWLNTSFIVVIISQVYIKRRYSEWFAKHNFLMSAALDSGASLMAFFVSVVFYGAAGGKVIEFPSWWGNDLDATYIDKCCKNC
ncbi:OPT family small oligopeptide transporter [Mucor mucedo]|uniref:OPT family small oligopeptide transporter n=1 Tax=Mucor mucedo TaxID=29922 RepID=UPI002220153B|nr:OPT family small oligopeptide transporter [Mucor mucedo]KAI7895930.1 OPT family small oligopeptide transporter [Mucor mucedo]